MQRETEDEDALSLADFDDTPEGDPEQIAGPEWAEWYLMSATERWPEDD